MDKIVTEKRQQYPPEVRQRAVQMVLEHRPEVVDSRPRPGTTPTRRIELICRAVQLELSGMPCCVKASQHAWEGEDRVYGLRKAGPPP